MILTKFLECRKQFFGLCYHFAIGGLLGVFILLVLLSIAVFQIKKDYEGRVYPNVYLGQIAVSGKTESELKDFLARSSENINHQKIYLFWDGENQVQKWEVTPQKIDFYLNQEESFRQVFSFGRQDEGIKGSFLELYYLLLFPKTVQPDFAFNQEKLSLITAEMKSVVDRPAKEALFDFKDGRVVNFADSQVGRQLEEQEVSALVVFAFSTLEPKEELNLDLPVRQILPRISTDETNDLGIKEKLGEGESFFFDSIPSRIHNIALAASKLHGLVIAPGETFSFAEKVGTISAQFGYQQAYVIKDRKTVLEDGGGVCQVSTTIFRAALNAGLPIVERKAHYYRVGFYEQGGYMPGLDATVYPPSPDFKFQNDTPAYILVQVSIDREKKRLGFTFYGTSDGRKTEVAKPVIHSQTAPPEPVYIDDPKLPAGAVKQTDKPHWGAKVSVKRKVFWANGTIKEENEFWSSYTAWPAFYLRGTGQ